MPKKRRAPERQLHTQIVKYLVAALPQNCFYFPVPNAGNISPVRGAMLRRSGEVRAGVPDIIIIHAGKVIGVELKAPTGGGLSKSQKEIRDLMLLAGCTHHIVRSVEEMHALLQSYQVQLRVRLQ